MSSTFEDDIPKIQHHVFCISLIVMHSPLVNAQTPPLGTPDPELVYNPLYFTGIYSP